jgi:hypothetical protein
VVTEAIIFFLVETERLLGITFLNAGNQFIILAIVRIHPMDGKEILLMPDVLLVGGAEKTLAKREVIDGIQDVGLPCPVEAHETIDVLRQLQICRFTVLEVRQFEFVEIHFFLIMNVECGMRKSKIQRS